VYRYYALSAISALFKHAELKLNTRYASCSLRIRYVPVEGTMMIDPDTARNLELVGNMARKKSSHSLFGCVQSQRRGLLED
jgi:DNA mismatch repair protein MSH4